jgi:carbon monoxide dehydrogenase subunit G
MSAQMPPCPIATLREIVMLTLILFLVIAAIAVFLVYIALKSADFRITRSRSIKAPPEALFALINDLHGFNRWNPFAQNDPLLKIDYNGPQSGLGANYAWTSTGKSGQGRMEITESSAPSVVRMRLEFVKPFSATNTAEFSLEPAGAVTTVTWSMTGRNSYMHRLMGTIMNFDKMVGGEFLKGLANLQALVER